MFTMESSCLKQMERVYTDAAQSSLDAFEHNLESGDTSDPRSNTVNDWGEAAICCRLHLLKLQTNTVSTI